MLIEPIINEIDPSWYDFIMNKEVQKEIKKIESKLTEQFYPETKNVLRFLKQDLSNIKYIIVGMDPYPSSYKLNKKEYPIATGRSFEVANYTDWETPTRNKSLTNILKAIYKETTSKDASIKEIRKEIKNGSFKILSPNKLFDDLESQGILFLNYAFTVKPKEPGSHLSIWKNFSLMLQEYIVKNYPEIKWILWGEDANNALGKNLDAQNKITNIHPVNNGFVKDSKLSELKDINLKGRTR